MDLSKLVSISGKPGLYRVIADIRNGILVESLDDGKRFPAHGSLQVSSLQDISIYCTNEDMPLGDVMDKIFDHLQGLQAPDYKSEPQVLRKFFSEALPEHDQERVYVSDIKKVVRWYNILLDKKLLDKKKEEKKEEKKEQTANKQIAENGEGNAATSQKTSTTKKASRRAAAEKKQDKADA